MIVGRERFDGGRQEEPVRGDAGGCLALIAGAAATFASIETGTPVILFFGSAIAGLGFGPTFMGAYRSTVTLATPADRAGLITAIYIVSHLSTGIPAVIGGVATSHYGLHATALVYLVAVAALAAAAVSVLAHQMATGRTERPTERPRAPLGAARCRHAHRSWSAPEKAERDRA